MCIRSNIRPILKTGGVTVLARGRAPFNGGRPSAASAGDPAQPSPGSQPRKNVRMVMIEHGGGRRLRARSTLLWRPAETVFAARAGERSPAGPACDGGPPKSTSARDRSFVRRAGQSRVLGQYPASVARLGLFPQRPTSGNLPCGNVELQKLPDVRLRRLLRHSSTHYRYFLRARLGPQWALSVNSRSSNELPIRAHSSHTSRPAPMTATGVRRAEAALSIG